MLCERQDRRVGRTTGPPATSDAPTPVDPRPPVPTPRPGPHAGAVRYLAGVALLAAAYFAAGKAGLAFPSVGEIVTLVWPPTGIAVAVLLRFGLRYWPGVPLGALAINAGLVSEWALVGIAAGNTLAPVAAVLMLRRLRFDPSFAVPARPAPVRRRRPGRDGAVGHQRGRLAVPSTAPSCSPSSPKSGWSGGSGTRSGCWCSPRRC